MINKDEYKSEYDYDRLVALIDTAKQNNHGFWIGDIPVTGTLRKFYNEIKFKRPDMVVHTDFRPARYNGLEYLVFADLAVAYEQSPTVRVGRIGLELNANKEVEYVVESPRIMNEKYASYSEGYRIKTTKKFANGVKNALQYLKPKTFNEVTHETTIHLERAVASMKEPAQNKLYEASRIGRNDILEELHFMVQSGYEPITQSFRNSLNIIREQGEELRAIDNYKPRKCFVWSKTDRIEYRYDGETEPHVVFNIQDVPENIRDKIAVLQINDGSKTALMDVGYKIDNDMYWVFV
jgi:hypothetical protein